LEARGSEAHALCLAGDVVSTSCTEDAEVHYCQALTLAAPRRMRPLIAHVTSVLASSIAKRAIASRPGSKSLSQCRCTARWECNSGRSRPRRRSLSCNSLPAGCPDNRIVRRAIVSQQLRCVNAWSQMYEVERGRFGLRGLG